MIESANQMNRFAPNIVIRNNEYNNEYLGCSKGKRKCGEEIFCSWNIRRTRRFPKISRARTSCVFRRLKGNLGHENWLVKNLNNICQFDILTNLILANDTYTLSKKGLSDAAFSIFSDNHSIKDRTSKFFIRDYNPHPVGI